MDLGSQCPGLWVRILLEMDFLAKILLVLLSQHWVWSNSPVCQTDPVMAEARHGVRPTPSTACPLLLSPLVLQVQMVSVFVSRGYWWLKTPEIYPVTIVEAPGPE